VGNSTRIDLSCQRSSREADLLLFRCGLRCLACETGSGHGRP
jgi:hypothetical protein